MAEVEEGVVEALTIPRLIDRLSQEGRSGVLEIEHEGGVSRAYLRQGALCGALVASRFKPLGIYLLEQGVIDVEALDRSLAEVAKGGRKQGEVLVELGYISKDSLREYLEAQQRENLGRLLTISAGRYRFDPGATPPDWTNDVALTAEEILRGWAAQHGQGLADRLGEDPLKRFLNGGTDAGSGTPSARKAAAGASGKASDRKAVKARRSKLLKRAIKNIPGAEAFSKKERGEPQRPSAPSVGAKDKGAPPVARPNASRTLSLEAQKLEREVREKAAKVAKQNFYERLEIDRDAPTERVKAAYFVLVKKYHPDRAGSLGLPEDCRLKMNEIFSAIQEAYETLSQPERRQAYDRSLEDERIKGDRQKARRVARGELCLKKGIALAKKKDWNGAIEQLEEAKRILGEGGELSLHLAWALWNRGPRKEVEGRVRRLLKLATAPGEPDSVRARGYYYLGLLARIDEKWDEAEKLFTRAVKIDEKLTEAVTELRVLRRRLERTEVTGRSLLNKLFGK